MLLAIVSLLSITFLCGVGAYQYIKFIEIKTRNF